MAAELYLVARSAMSAAVPARFLMASCLGTADILTRIFLPVEYSKLTSSIFQRQGKRIKKVGKGWFPLWGLAARVTGVRGAMAASPDIGNRFAFVC
jgi:hypothetical protein